MNREPLLNTSEFLLLSFAPSLDVLVAGHPVLWPVLSLAIFILLYHVSEIRTAARRPSIAYTVKGADPASLMAPSTAFHR